MNAKKFQDFLLRKQEQLDDALFARTEPVDIWLGGITTGRVSSRPRWWMVREIVRKLSEGMAFVPSEVAKKAENPLVPLVDFQNSTPKWKKFGDSYETIFRK